MDNVIHVKVRLNYSQQQSFEIFTKESNVKKLAGRNGAY